MDSRRHAWLVVALLGVVACLNCLDRQVIFSVFPLLRAEMHLDDLQLGLLSTALARPEIYGIFNLVGCVVGGAMAAAAGALKPVIGPAGSIQIAALMLLGSSISLFRVSHVFTRDSATSRTE